MQTTSSRRKLIDRSIAPTSHSLKGSTLFDHHKSLADKNQDKACPPKKNEAVANQHKKEGKTIVQENIKETAQEINTNKSQEEVQEIVRDKVPTQTQSELTKTIKVQPQRPIVLDTSPPPKLYFQNLETHAYANLKLNKVLFLQIYPQRPGLDEYPRFMATTLYMSAPENLTKEEKLKLETNYSGLEWNPAWFLIVWSEIVINGFSEIPTMEEEGHENYNANYKNWVYLLRRGLSAQPKEMITFVRRGPVTGTTGIDILFTQKPVRQNFLF